MQNATEPSSPLLDGFFRRQYSRCVAHLVRRLGQHHLDLAEEAVQEALLRALRTWPLRGIPDRPEAWLLRVAHHYAIDICRKEQRFRNLEASLQMALASPEKTAPSVGHFESELRNDTLAMMFLCCHPSLPPPSRVALTLKVVSGFGIPEIARTFFTAETTIAQRIVRAKRQLRELEVSLDIPPPELLPERLNSVLDVLYLLFNEGYTCHEGEEILQVELMEEALRLISELTQHPTGNTPHAHALAALMFFQSSRIKARIDGESRLLPLLEQDRQLWDQARIQRGLQHLDQAATGQALTEYHLLAGIAACHATSQTPSQTPWKRIASLYDALLELNGNFVTQLNRAVAHAHAYGPQTGLALLDALATRKALQEYHLLAAARADCLQRLGRYEEAKQLFQRAAQLAPTSCERRFLLDRADAQQDHQSADIPMSTSDIFDA